MPARHSFSADGKNDCDFRAFEQEAKKSGAFRMTVEPFGWNAAFFRKNGYNKVTGVPEDFPKGHTMYCMDKPL